MEHAERKSIVLVDSFITQEMCAYSYSMESAFYANILRPIIGQCAVAIVQQ